MGENVATKKGKYKTPRLCFYLNVSSLIPVVPLHWFRVT
jgi:hypothetical protein